MEYKISTEYDGNTRKLYKTICNQCSGEYWIPLHKLESSKCCSTECYKLYRQQKGKRIDTNCFLCDKVFKRWQHHLAKVVSGKHFCSRECQREASIKYKGNCLYCQTILIGKARKYCSRNCQIILTNQNNIDKWKSGEINGINAGENLKSWIKRFLIEKNGNRCSKCGWCEINSITKKIPIQVDHIDGDYKNNLEENLRLLCPNCHSLTPTYGALNKGKGREKRKLKLQIISSTNKLI